MKTSSIKPIVLVFLGLAIFVVGISLAVNHRTSIETQRDNQWNKLADVPASFGVFWTPYKDTDNRGFIILTKDERGTNTIFLSTVTN